MRIPAPYRWLAAALATVWLALPVAAAVHGVVEAHEYCAQHQAVEHAGHGGADVAGEGIRNTVAGGDVHQACAFDDACFRDGVALRAAPPADMTLPIIPTRRLRARVVAVSGEVLATAPKTSPPAANG